MPPMSGKTQGKKLQINNISLLQIFIEYNNSILFVGKNDAFWRKGYTVVLFDERAIL